MTTLRERQQESPGLDFRYGKYFSLYHRVQNDHDLPVSFPVVDGGSFMGNKAARAWTRPPPI